MDGRVIGVRKHAVLRTAMPGHDIGEAVAAFSILLRVLGLIRIAARLRRACLFLRLPRLAREALPPQFLRAVAHALNGCVKLCHRLRGVGFLLLARLEKALGAVLCFMLGHANSTRRAVGSSESRHRRHWSPDQTTRSRSAIAADLPDKRETVHESRNMRCIQGERHVLEDPGGTRHESPSPPQSMNA